MQRTWQGWDNSQSKLQPTLREPALNPSRACYGELTDTDRCRAIEYLGLIPCAANGSLTVTREQDGNIRYSTCSHCENPKISDSESSQSGCQRVSQDCISILSIIVKSQSFKSARRPRVLAMITLKRFAMHFREPDFIFLEESFLAHFCFQSLNSSIRELRVSAG
jgi:serine/threonine-protein kinase ATR